MTDPAATNCERVLHARSFHQGLPPAVALERPIKAGRWVIPIWAQATAWRPPPTDRIAAVSAAGAPGRAMPSAPTTPAPFRLG
jgi:hypothetical protein